MKEKAISTGMVKAERSDAAARQVAVSLFWAVMGLLTPRVSVYGGLSPFGVGLSAAACGAGGVFTYAAVAAGYLLGGDSLFLFRYLAAVTIAAGVRWSFGGLRGANAAKWLPPIAGFVASVTAGFAVQIPAGLSVYTVLALLCEGVLAGGFARLCHIVDGVLRQPERQDYALSAVEQVAITSVAAVALMSLVDVSIGGLSSGRVLAATAVLLFARSGKEQSGGIAGTALGTALLLTNSAAGMQAMAMAFGGLIAGMFARINRFAAAGIYLVVTTLLVMAGGDGTLVALTAYEAAIAAVLFVLIPTAVDRRINGFFLRGTEMPAVEGLRRSVSWRLDYAARAMDEVAGTVNAVAERLSDISAPDLGTLCRDASDELCRSCANHTRCWDGGYGDTMDSFNKMTDVLRKDGTVRREQLEGRLTECPQAEKILHRVNDGYGRFLMRESAFRRLADIRAVASDQFHAMADMLGELSDSVSAPSRVDEQSAVRVREICEQYGLQAQEVICLVDRSGRMEVDLMVADTDLHFDEHRWQEQMGDACGRTFQKPTVTRMGSVARVALREKPRWKVTVGQAQLCCSGEQLCGDATDVFDDPSGRTILLLSDGMGCGGRAAVDGAMAAGLTARLLQAGFGADSVLRMVNAALMVKSGDESLATLDIAAIDPFSGRMESLKAGATVSLLKSGGRVSRIERTSLPLGILRDITFEKSYDTLVGGDILLLFSDGAVSESIAAAEEILRDYDGEHGSMQNLAERVASAARRLQQASGSRDDDITVIAAQITECA